MDTAGPDRPPQLSSDARARHEREAALRRRRALFVVAAAVLAVAVSVLVDAFVSDPGLARILKVVVIMAVPFAAAFIPGLNPAWRIRWSHPDDVVERRWEQRAFAGAFGDVVVLAAVALLVLTLGRFEVDAAPVLTALVVVALLDAAVRYWRLARAALG